MTDHQEKMYQGVKEKYQQEFGGTQEIQVFSAPGRSELGGNHTDHQLGKVLACAISLESVAAVTCNKTNKIIIKSEGYPLCEISLNDLKEDVKEYGTTQSLIRGVAAAFQNRGIDVPGFTAYVTTEVFPGSGLSSSASFEVLVGTIINGLTGNTLDAVEIAKIGQYAENVYFGKPCGLMDQMACSVGNIIAIDFKEKENPVVTPIPFDFSKTDHALCIIDCGADHADLTDEYAQITLDLKHVCDVFEKKVLREVPEELFYERISQVRAAAGDRAVLRAMHVYEENRRVEAMTEALQKNDFDEFLKIVSASGRSSWIYLQNVIPCGRTDKQELALAIACAERILQGKGAFRVHGGGFAGTMQAYVPTARLAFFKEEMEKILGEGKCHVLSVYPYGGRQILAE